MINDRLGYIKPPTNIEVAKRPRLCKACLKDIKTGEPCVTTRNNHWTVNTCKACIQRLANEL